MLKSSILIWITLFSLALQSKVLIPDASISWEQYKQQCVLNSYQCSNVYFVQKLKNEEASTWSDYLKKIDLDDSHFRKNFEDSLKRIIKTDVLKLRDFEMILALCDQLLVYDPNSLRLQILRKQFENLVQYLKSISNYTADHTQYLLGDVLLIEKDLEVLKKILLPLNIYKISYNQWPQRLNILESFNQSKFDYFISNQCHTNQLAHWPEDHIILQSDKCQKGFEFNRLVDSSKSFISDNKKPIFVTLAAILMIGLAQNYEIELQH